MSLAPRHLLPASLLLAAWITQANADQQPAALAVIDSPFLLFDLSEHLSADVQLADLDGDGDLDVALANGRHWAEPDRVYLNNGRGRLLEARALGDALRPTYMLALADLDRDGDTDIVAVYDDIPARIWLNDGHANFSGGAQIGQSGGDSRSALLRDLDGDGNPDLVLARRGDPDLLYLGDGQGGFGEARQLGDTDGASTGVASADFDADGHLDLAFARRDQQPALILFGAADAARRFQRQSELPDSMGDNRKILAADINGDGKADLVLGRIGAANAVFWGKGDGTFAAGPSFGSSDGRTYSLAVADLDQDGDLDLIEGNDEQRNWIYLNLGEDRFERVALGEEEADSYGIAVGELSGDEQLDVVVANSGAANQVFLLRPAKTQ